MPTSPTPERGEVTQLLSAAAGGDSAALNDLLPVVYDELRKLAQGYLAGERPNHTLSATALAHEVYLRMVRQNHIAATDRREFFGVAASAMRRILVDHARTRKRKKRGGGRPVSSLDDRVAAVEHFAIDLVALDEALTTLAEIDPVKARLVELRFFGEVSMSDAAEILDIPKRTAERHWTMARAWLRTQIQPTVEGSGS